MTRQRGGALLAWYARHRRALPWRRTRDTYRILVSEVMLQQTQVERVIPFYRCFLARFPDARALARAGAEAIHRAWKGLGYPSRVERLQAACRVVLAAGGRWPDTPDRLMELPGIGPYTAHAVACLAFGRAVPLVDTNVARVYARRDRLVLPVDRAALWAHAARQVDPENPISYNNALMELGALVCTARQPRCGDCPWRRRCAARDDAARHRATANPLRPVTAKRCYGVAVTDRTRPRRHRVIALVHHDGKYLVMRRSAGPSQKTWDLPGVGRISGEGDRTTLARELRQTLGGDLLAARALVDFSLVDGAGYLTCHVYRCRLFDPEALRSRSGIRWVEPKVFVALKWPPLLRPLRERLRRYHGDQRGVGAGAAAGATAGSIRAPRCATAPVPRLPRS
jgi:A/G-specific adenine glycosylase